MSIKKDGSPRVRKDQKIQRKKYLYKFHVDHDVLEEESQEREHFFDCNCEARENVWKIHESMYLMCSVHKSWLEIPSKNEEAMTTSFI